MPVRLRLLLTAQVRANPELLTLRADDSCQLEPENLGAIPGEAPLPLGGLPVRQARALDALYAAAAAAA